MEAKEEEEGSKVPIDKSEDNLPSQTENQSKQDEQDLVHHNESVEEGSQEISDRPDIQNVLSPSRKNANVVVEPYEDLDLNANEDLMPLINRLEEETNQVGIKFSPGEGTLEKGRKYRFFNKESLLKCKMKKSTLRDIAGDDSTVAAVLFLGRSDAGLLTEQTGSNIMESIRKELEMNPKLASEESSEAEYSMTETVKPKKKITKEGPPKPVEPNKTDLSHIFYLMSIAPTKSIHIFKDALDQNVTWSPSLSNILLVFLNWGANLQHLPITNILRSDDIVMLEEAAQATKRFEDDHGPIVGQGSQGNQIIPTHMNIKMVLSVVEQRISKLNISDRQKLVIIKLLIFVSVESNLKELSTSFYRAISAIIESFSNPWTCQLAAMISNLLSLSKLMIKSATFVCCCLLNLTSRKLQTFGFYAACSVLQDKFNLKQFGSQPMLGFFTELPTLAQLLSQYKVGEIFSLVQILETLLMRNLSLNYPITKEEVQSLKDWTISVRDALNSSDHIDVESDLLRERCTRLTTSIISFMEIKFDENPTVMLRSDKENQSEENKL